MAGNPGGGTDNGENGLLPEPGSDNRSSSDVAESHSPVPLGPRLLLEPSTLNLHTDSSGDSGDLIPEMTAIMEQLIGRENLATFYSGLGEGFRRTYANSGDLNDLDAWLDNAQTAVERTREKQPDKVRYLQSLAQASTERYRRLGDPKDLETTLQVQQEILDLTAERDPNKAGRLQTLGASFTEKYHRFGALTDLKAALQANQEALDLTAEGHPDKPQHLQRLGLSLRAQYQRSGDVTDLDTTIKAFQEAVDLTPAEDPNKSGCLQDLGVSFLDRYQRLGDLNDLEASRKILQEAVDLTPAEHHAKPGRLHDLAVSFSNRYQRFGDLKDLEVAMNAFQGAADLTPEGHRAQSGNLWSLGVCLSDRYQRLGDLKDLEAAIHATQQAVDLTAEGHIEKASYLKSLGVCLGQKYQRIGDLKDVDSAIKALQKAADLTPAEHADKSKYLLNLAISFSDRYQRLGDPKDLEAAIVAGQEALNLTPEGHPDRAGTLRNLAEYFRCRYGALGDLKDLDVALVANREAVYLTPDGNPEKAGHLQSLAVSLRARYKRFNNLEDLADAHTHYSNSFNNPSSNPEQSWEQALQWASFSTESHPSNCIVAYTAAFRLLPELLWIGHSIPVRHDAIHRLGVAQATSNAVQHCIGIANLTGAVEIMEQGVATIFQQMLQLKTEADDLPPHLANEFQRLSSQLYGGTLDNPMNLVNARNDLLKDIRQKPGFEYFLLPKPYDVLSHAAQRGPVVILNSHKDHCDAIIIPRPTCQPVHVPFPNVTLELLKSAQVQLKDLLHYCSVRTRGESASSRLFGQREDFSSKPTQERFVDMLDWFWNDVVEPVYQVLELHGIRNGRLWWLPTGAFSGLPFHASPPTDQFIHSYTATLGSLLEAYAKKCVSATPRVSVIGVTHTSPNRRNFLKCVESEVKRIISVIKDPFTQCLEGERATVDGVKHQLENCSWLHLACHGKQDLINPTKSHLLLYGGTLELETILRMSLPNAEFVFLAACQTAMGDATLVNESFHLGGGLIAAGFRGAIGTMWSIHDEDGPVIAEIVYSHLCRDVQQAQGSDAAEGLQLAVKELKNRKVPYERWIPFIHMGI
ncbi:CHAT domain-containing protein [Mycena vulgaris]|nr:CHAT domain-containing protein [Mycena vulgaris]